MSRRTPVGAFAAVFAAVFGGGLLAGDFATGVDGAFFAAFVDACAVAFLVAGGEACLAEATLLVFAAVLVVFFALLVAGPGRPPDRDAAAIATPLCTAIALLSSGRKEAIVQLPVSVRIQLGDCQASYIVPGKI